MSENKPIKNPMKDPLGMLGAAISGLQYTGYGKEPAFRQEALCDEVGVDSTTIIVDTVCPDDTKVWETGIKHGSHSWVIVEQYATKEDAVEGHARWLQSIKDDPNQTLTDIFTTEMNDEYDLDLDSEYNPLGDDYDTTL